MRRGGLGVVIALLAAAATACDGSGSTADPSSPTPITGTPSSQTTSAKATASLDPGSDAAILAAVQAYAAAFTKVGQEASTNPLNGVVDPRCPCAKTLSSLASQLSAQHKHVDARISAKAVRILRRTKTNADVYALIENPTYRILDLNGSLVGTGKAASTPTTLSLERRSDEWLVFYVDSPS